MKVLKLTKVLPKRDHRFEMEGWETVGPILFALDQFIVSPCDLDPKVSLVSCLDRDVFVKESVEEIEALLREAL